MQTQTANSLIWAETALDLECDNAFIPSVAERVSFSALQVVSGKSSSFICKMFTVFYLLAFSLVKYWILSSLWTFGNYVLVLSSHHFYRYV